MNKEEIKKVIVAQNEVTKSINFIQRDKTISLEGGYNDPFIQIVSGIRRCGKSTLVQHIRENNPEKNYSINFDDNRLVGFSNDDFEKLNEAFHELYEPENTYYFNEIQNVDGWERFVRRLYNEGNKIYITGSNATMLSKELGTHLTGRNIQTELFPFSFNEYLRFKGIQLEKNDFYSAEKSTQLKKAFRNYILNGGFPEFLQTSHLQYLKNLYENIIYKDVIARYNIRNVKTITEMIHFLISNISKEISYNGLKNVFGLSNAISVKEYISYFENAYLIFSINKFDFSLKKQLANPKKIYSIDTGLANSVSFQFSDNFGRQLENVVFLQLKRKGHEIYYHKNKQECDFIIRENGKIINAFQVCQSIENSDTKSREINGLLEAMQQYDLTNGLIITEDEEEIIKLNECTIQVIPVWKWLLG
ncbi:MAG: ATP-binding protein [Bacteroidales bacterium]|nr:ATP-binding protein [Bacteroidales bacterium]